MRTGERQWSPIGSIIELFGDYEKRQNDVQVLASAIVQQLIDTDIFVLISDPKGTDMFVELGVVLGQKNLGREKRIYIVGEHSKRSLIQLHLDILHALLQMCLTRKVLNIKTSLFLVLSRAYCVLTMNKVTLRDRSPCYNKNT